MNLDDFSEVFGRLLGVDAFKEDCESRDRDVRRAAQRRAIDRCRETGQAIPDWLFRSLNRDCKGA